MRCRHLFVYCDASYDKELGFGVGGYLIFDNASDHAARKICSGCLVTEKIEEITHIRVELKAAIHALTATLKRFPPTNRPVWLKSVVNLFTDCNAIASLPSRRVRLEDSGFIVKKKATVLANADLYREFYSLQDKMDIRISRLSGHTPKDGRSTIESNFSMVDRGVRKALRRYRPT